MTLIRPRLLRHARAGIAGLLAEPAFLFAQQQALCIYQAAAIYSFIPKNASGTMRFSLAVANGCLPPDGDFRWIHHNNPTFQADLRQLAAAEYTFVILRDPFRRLASCYLDQIVNRRPSARLFCERQAPRSGDAGIGPDKAPSLDPHDVTFRQFVTGLGPLLADDFHWRPQSDFLVYRDYDNWFSLEDFQGAVDTIERRTGMKVHDARDHWRYARRDVPTEAGRALMDLPARDHAAMKKDGIFPRIEAMYDDELIERVRSYYRDDIELYREKTGQSSFF